MQKDQSLDFAERYTAARGAARMRRAWLPFIQPMARCPSMMALHRSGADAIMEVAQSFMTSFPDLRVVMDKVLVQGDRTEYHWTLIGTNTSPGGTGHRVGISGFELWQIGADGLLASSRGHFEQVRILSSTRMWCAGAMMESPRHRRFPGSRAASRKLSSDHHQSHFEIRE